ncbi:MAG: helix-turn-helix domain-containing protein [Promethearchaeota archaeon]
MTNVVIFKETKKKYCKYLELKRIVFKGSRSILPTTSYERSQSIALIDELIEFGLSSSEAQILWILLRNSRPMSGNEVSEHTDLIRHYVFELLKRLARRGFVEEIPERPRRYTTALDILERRIGLLEQECENVCQTLEDDQIPAREKMDLLGLDEIQIDLYLLLHQGHETRRALKEHSGHSYEIIRKRTDEMAESGIVKRRRIGKALHYIPLPLETVIQVEISSRKAKWLKHKERLQKSLEKLRMYLWRGKDEIGPEEMDIVLLRGQKMIEERIKAHMIEADRVLSTLFVHVTHNVELFTDLANRIIKIFAQIGQRGAEIRSLVEDFFPFVLSSLDEKAVVDFLTISPKVQTRIAPFPLPCLIIIDKSLVFEFPSAAHTLDKCVLYRGETLAQLKITEFFESWERASDIRPFLREIFNEAAWKEIEESLTRDPTYTFKLVICGPSSVGKTTLIRRFCTKKFIPELKATMGLDLQLRSYTLEVDNRTYNVRLQLWDFGGEERFRVLLGVYSQGSHAIIYALDSTQPSSLEELNEYAEILEKEDAYSALISTKHDLVSEVTDDEIQNFQEKYNITKYYRTSSVTGEGIETLFLDLATHLVQEMGH